MRDIQRREVAIASEVHCDGGRWPSTLHDACLTDARECPDEPCHLALSGFRQLLVFIGGDVIGECLRVGSGRLPHERIAEPFGQPISVECAHQR
jgi:hypothetical protein